MAFGPIKKAIKTAVKKARSVTRTRTKTKSQKIIRSPGDGTLSSSYGTHGKPVKTNYSRTVRALCGRQTILEQYTAVFNGAMGEQGVLALPTFFTTGNISGMFFQAIRMYTDSNTFNPIEAVSNTSAAFGNARLIFEGSKRDSMYTNASDFPCFVTILDLVFKKDIPQAGTNYAPAELWKRGYDDLQKSSTGPPSYPAGVPQEYPFMYPTNSAEFNKYWKVCKVTRVQMAAGRTHRHVYEHKQGRIIKHDEIQQAIRLTDNGYWKDVTTSVLVLVNGVPVVNSLDANQVSLSKPELLYREAVTHYYRGIAVTPKFNAQNGVLPSFATAKLQATEITEELV